MSVAELLLRIRDLLPPNVEGLQRSEADEGLIQLIVDMERFGTLSVESFLGLLAKVKLPKPPPKPKKTAEEKEREKQEAARLKAEAKAQAAAAKQAEKIAKKAKADAEKREKAERAAQEKAEAKLRAEAEKREKAERAAQEKAEAKLRAEAEKKRKKELAEQEALQAAEKAVHDSIDELKALLMRFRGGNVPAEVVNEPLEKLKGMKAPQLLVIARAINVDATLTEKSTKAKILKQITEMVRSVWKTSDNVHH